MQIFTLDDLEFQELLSAWNKGKIVGKFWQKGKVRIVRACKKFVLISPGNKVEKFALKPAKDQAESFRLAKQFLLREEKRGSKIEMSDTHLNKDN